MGPPGPAGPAEAERLAYQTLADLMNSEEAAFWTRNNILVLVQGGLIAAAAGIVGNADKIFGAEAQPRAEAWLFAVLAVLALVGLATATAWLLTVQRGQRIADTIRHQLSDIEADWQARGLLPHRAPISYLAFTRWARQLNNDEAAPSAWNVPRRWHNSQRLTRIWTGLGSLFALLWTVLVLAFAVAWLKAYAAPAGAPPPTNREQALVQATQAAASAAAAAAMAAGQATLAAAAAASAADTAARAAAACGARRSSASGPPSPGGARGTGGASTACR